MTQFARAQSDQAPQHVVLPPAFGGTPLSHQIHAEAAYVAAYGDMVKSVAMRRKINAQAVALEIQNLVAYVDAYFKRREINREARAKEDPSYPGTLRKTPGASPASGRTRCQLYWRCVTNTHWTASRRAFTTLWWLSGLSAPECDLAPFDAG